MANKFHAMQGSPSSAPPAIATQGGGSMCSVHSEKMALERYSSKHSWFMATPVATIASKASMASASHSVSESWSPHPQANSALHMIAAKRSPASSGTDSES